MNLMKSPSLAPVLRVAFFVAAALALAAPPFAAGSPRPNVLFVFCDDHTTQALSSYGDSRELIDTPNLDRIAAEGMKFTRCLVPNSICGPVRATILTGKYSHKNGFYKLVHYYKPDLDDWELYDLQENPLETINFIDDPAYAGTIAELREEIARLREKYELPPLDEEPRSAYGRAPFDSPGQVFPAKGKAKARP